MSTFWSQMSDEVLASWRDLLEERGWDEALADCQAEMDLRYAAAHPSQIVGIIAA